MLSLSLGLSLLKLSIIVFEAFSVESFFGKFPSLQKRPSIKFVSATFQPSDLAHFQPFMSAKFSVPK